MQTIWIEQELSSESLVQYKALSERIKRLDFRFDRGFVDHEPYVFERTQLQSQIDDLIPKPNHELVRSLETLSRFSDELSVCNDDVEKQHRLLKKFIQRVSVSGERVVEISVKDGLRVIIGDKQALKVALEAQTTYESQFAGFEGTKMQEVKRENKVFKSRMWAIKWAQRGLDAHVCQSGIWFVPDHLHIKSIKYIEFL